MGPVVDIMMSYMHACLLVNWAYCIMRTGLMDWTQSRTGLSNFAGNDFKAIIQRFLTLVILETLLLHYNN